MKRAVTVLLLLATALSGQQEERSTYLLGPGDRIMVRVQRLAELNKEEFQIDMRGNVNVPVAGRVHAAGMTLEQVEHEIAELLMPVLKRPQVTVSLMEMRSQPVSVLGAVKNPGVMQVQGDKTLLEMISLAGGLREDAGYSIRITRKKEWGPIPLPEAKQDLTGRFYVGEVGVKEILEAQSPEKNIAVKPNDVVTVPKGRLVFVMGAVKKSGGFVLGESERTTVLQALSMAEGTDNYANSKAAKIMRKTKKPEVRQEIAVDLARILSGGAQDVPMESEDILWVPTSGVKKAMMRTMEAAITVGTGMAIYRR